MYTSAIGLNFPKKLEIFLLLGLCSSKYMYNWRFKPEKNENLSFLLSKSHNLLEACHYYIFQSGHQLPYLINWDIEKLLLSFNVFDKIHFFVRIFKGIITKEYIRNHFCQIIMLNQESSHSRFKTYGDWTYIYSSFLWQKGVLSSCVKIEDLAIKIDWNSLYLIQSYKFM